MVLFGGISNNLIKHLKTKAKMTQLKYLQKTLDILSKRLYHIEKQDSIKMITR